MGITTARRRRNPAHHSSTRPIATTISTALPAAEPATAKANRQKMTVLPRRHRHRHHSDDGDPKLASPNVNRAPRHIAAARAGIPTEATQVQVKSEEVLRQTAATLTRLFVVTATKDWANHTAAADVVVDGENFLDEVTLPYLLFLEKQLADVLTSVQAAPRARRRRGLGIRRFLRYLAHRAGLHRPHQKGAAQPREGQSHRHAPDPGRDVLQGHRRRLRTTVKLE
ncbi:hypothetical protein [Nocardia amikacinitolerans]|uniref:DUF7873 family protein n=1 Tax=Nocardia amikacinitolerans TaxID=756689 RepID=UPI0015C7B737|nr:hypothetical protein [Nocardia amikacinitolerans]